MLREAGDSELVSSAETGHYWELEEGHGLRVVDSAGKVEDLELDFEV